ncbi:response regulator [Pedobacter rhizosphaerae]|uniref:cAMP-binding domain of CRP or a regulatory subunit of cAMP-dependent protein kinases n=1 Tax=Pedobacter rhizosphaerae TaxID=390241 RepID=A0A1H9UUI9_9SPHI|nr:response regulator [Pedobacter rhizosphaerae]SES12999.1 cAMP-binding domain of CRP or a regulatory subunit of cAMP-dependent protein kinases [Pedobacter rhizosphaerae]
MSKKVLIIEDNDDIREGTAEVLDLAGYETFTAKHGKIGVDLALKHLPDVILCDIMMPELDGYGVLYLLHKNPKTASIPFIFITAKTERADMRKGMEMGADDYLTKPFDDLELFKAIESRFKKRQQSAHAGITASDTETVLDEMKARGKTRTITAKQIVYVEDDEPSHLYYIVKGQVKTYKRFKDGRELSSSLYHNGDFFGYESLCNNEPYAENAATLVASEIIQIPKVDFMEYLLNYQSVSKTFISLLSGSVREKVEQMLQLAYSSVRKRVAEALLQVADKFGEDTHDTCTIKISRDDLAALVGTASETVSRMLADFKDEKLIDKTGNAINILSIDKLKKVKQ